MALGSLVGRIEAVESPIDLIPVLWKVDVSTFVKIHQLFRFLRWISLVEASIWVLSTFVVETTSWFPEETYPLQTKFCVICRRSFSEFAVTRTFTDLSSEGSVEIHQIFFLRWISCSSELETGHC